MLTMNETMATVMMMKMMNNIDVVQWQIVPETTTMTMMIEHEHMSKAGDTNIGL